MSKKCTTSNIITRLDDFTVFLNGDNICICENDNNIYLETITKTGYPVLVSYDEWEIFVFKNKFYVADKINNFIKQVELVKIELSENNTSTIVEYPDCDYCGQSDCQRYDMGFILLENKIKNTNK